MLGSDINATKIIKSGQLLRGDNLTLERDMLIVVRDGYIDEIKPLSDFRIDSDVELIDCSDKVLMPGLINSHNHLSLDSRLQNYLERMTDPIPALTIRAVRTLHKDLMAGITTLRCLGDKEYIDIECRKAID